jgi:hypothetical protein
MSGPFSGTFTQCAVQASDVSITATSSLAALAPSVILVAQDRLACSAGGDVHVSAGGRLNLVAGSGGVLVSPGSSAATRWGFEVTPAGDLAVFQEEVASGRRRVAQVFKSGFS